MLKEKSDKNVTAKISYALPSRSPCSAEVPASLPSITVKLAQYAPDCCCCAFCFFLCTCSGAGWCLLLMRSLLVKLPALKEDTWLFYIILYPKRLEPHILIILCWQMYVPSVESCSMDSCWPHVGQSLPSSHYRVFVLTMTNNAVINSSCRNVN